jgi:hypothetical protein
MAGEDLSVLGLDPAAVEMAVDFHEAYASVDESRGSTQSATWEELVDNASSLRTAAQWAMLIDPPRARRLMRRAGLIFHRLGYGFGTFLLVADGINPFNAREATRATGRLVNAISGRETSELASDDPLRHPQQQAYLMLACSGLPPAQLTRDNRGLLHEAAEASPHRRGVVPMGALAMPISRYWGVANTLLTFDIEPGVPDRRRDEAASSVVDALEPMCREYARSIDQAMVNQRLWKGAAAPVDVGDIDIASILSLSMRRIGPAAIRRQAGRLSEGLGPLAAIPLTYGLELGSQRDLPDDFPDDFADRDERPR